MNKTVAVDPDTVIFTMRQLKRLGVRTSSMDAAAIKYIMDNELIEQSLWPATTLRITEAGYEYILDHEAQQ